MTDMKSGTSSNMPNGNDLRRMYQTRFKGRLDYRNKVWSVLIRDYFQQFVRSTDTVLDLGAGYGEFINNIQCGKKYAIDLNPETRERVNADVAVTLQDCSTHWPLPNDSLDIVFTSNFFEHLPDKLALARTLREAHRCLKPGGRLIAIGPNITYCGDAYWEIIDHRIPLSEQSLSIALEGQGFHVEKSIAKFMPFTMSEGPRYPALFVSLYLRLPLVWRILGKQFLVIGRKQNA